jgi:hypothetical protein
VTPYRPQRRHRDVATRRGGTSEVVADGRTDGCGTHRNYDVRPRVADLDKIPQQDSAANAFIKLAGTFTVQMEALKRHCTGGEQRVIPQHVTVNEGGQAIVGTVSQAPGRTGGSKIGRRPHEKHACHAPQPAMHRHVEADAAAVQSPGSDRMGGLPVPRCARWRAEGCAQWGLPRRAAHGGGGGGTASGVGAAAAGANRHRETTRRVTTRGGFRDCSQPLAGTESASSLAEAPPQYIVRDGDIGQCAVALVCCCDDRWCGVVNDLIPDAIGAFIETAFVYGKAEVAAPVAGLATAAILRYLTGKLDTARNILRSQLERAGVTAADFRDAEQFGAAALRYIRAARDQTADENLRILAQAMVGLARRRVLWASDFLKFAEVLAPPQRR